MEDDILQVIEEESANDPSLEELKTALLEKGFNRDDIDQALDNYSDRFLTTGTHEIKKDIRLFTIKEILDRIGYGFATNQYINILFYQALNLAGLSHVALLFVGIINGAKSLLSTIISSFLQEFSKVRTLPKKLISASGIIFGFTFLFMAWGRSIQSPLLFAVALLVGSVGVVSYGDLYNQLLRENLKKERMGAFLRLMSQYGVLITALALMLSGWLMESIPVTGKIITIFGYSFRAYGYLISFEITAFAFILSGYVLAHLKHHVGKGAESLSQFTTSYFARVRNHLGSFFSNKYLALLFLATVVSGVAQSLGNSFYGIFIFERFNNLYFGGFLNVAIIFTVAVLASVIGPYITRKLSGSIGMAPMLVFGSMLIAMMPFFAAWQANFASLLAASALSIIGSSIVGVAQGLLARKLLAARERKLYFTALSLAIAIPYAILLPLGAWYAQVQGLEAMFRLLVYVIIGIVVPLYIILVAFANKRRY